MLVPIKWLNEYVDIEDIEIRELSERLTMTGSHVDSIINIDKKNKNIVIGKIIEINEHPEADKLMVTLVDIGKERIQIVTGAKNIKVGNCIPVALVGSVLADGTKIKLSKLRGIESEGMMCSYEELGVEDKLVPKESKNGILIFPEDAEIGSDAIEALGLKGYILDIEITFNRPDCLSIIGMARETAATFNRAYKEPEIVIGNEVDNILDYIDNIEIVDRDLCSRYYAKIIKNVKIGPSPLWLQRKIMDAGMRPINNIVDATNFVMLEMGQPLHAFDMGKMKGKKVVVRRAKHNETIITLDNENRMLDDNMLVIADEENSQCIAGVMGGLYSEISKDTKIILMESANFNPKSIRMTSKKMGLRSEASSRNEKNISPEIVSYANERVCQIIESIGAGVIVRGNIDVRVNNKIEKRIIILRPSRCNHLLGTEISTKEMIKILNNLSIKSIIKNDDIISEIPDFRMDIEQEADLIEEVGRIYGFEKIEPKPLRGNILKGTKSVIRMTEDIIKETIAGSGFFEITTYSFISPKKYEKLKISENNIMKKYIKIINPLGEDFSSMRTTLTANMMDTISKNVNHGIKSGGLFEIGNIFMHNNNLNVELPDEISTLCIGLFGKEDFYYLKGVIENLMTKLSVDTEYVKKNNLEIMHPGRSAEIISNGVILGYMGEVHPDVIENFELSQKVYIAELDIKKILDCENVIRKFEEIPKYPPVTRDIAIVVKDEIQVGQILNSINGLKEKLLENVEFFDLYKGKGIAENSKSIAFSLTFRSNKKTLSDDEVDLIYNKIICNLEQKFDAKLR